MSAKLNNYALNDFILINNMSQNRKRSRKIWPKLKGLGKSVVGGAYSFVLNQIGANLVTPTDVKNAHNNIDNFL
jgi:hypothetical protein